MLPACNGVMTVNREYTGETPCGMKFTTLAGVMGGGASSPGFVGHSKFNITQRKFIVGDGGLLRMVWMPKILKDEIKERLDSNAARKWASRIYRHDRRRDRGHHRGRDPALPPGKGHPALSMDPIMADGVLMRRTRCIRGAHRCRYLNTPVLNMLNNSKEKKWH
jgi:acetyl-CoA synthase